MTEEEAAEEAEAAGGGAFLPAPPPAAAAALAASSPSPGATRTPSGALSSLATAHMCDAISPDKPGKTPAVVMAGIPAARASASAERASFFEFLSFFERKKTFLSFHLLSLSLSLSQAKRHKQRNLTLAQSGSSQTSTYGTFALIAAASGAGTDDDAPPPPPPPPLRSLLAPAPPDWNGPAQ